MSAADCESVEKPQIGFTALCNYLDTEPSCAEHGIISFG